MIPATVRSRLVGASSVVAVAGFDAWVVEGVIKPCGAVEAGLDKIYHLALFAYLVPSISILLYISLLDWRAPLYLLAATYSGVEDILYYAILMEPLPERFTWVPGEPTLAELAARSIAAMSLAALIDYVMSRRMKA